MVTMHRLIPGFLIVVAALLQFGPVERVHGQEPSFTPYDTPPELVDPEGLQQALSQLREDVEGRLRTSDPGFLIDGEGNTRELELQAAVSLWLFVDETGRVEQVRPREDLAHARSAVIEALAELAGELEFEPARQRDGTAVGGWVRMPILFEAGDRGPCPRSTNWPSLPEEGRTVFGVMQGIGELAGDPRGVRVRDVPLDSVSDREVEVPQYGYFHHPSTGTCEPVIIVQAAAGALGYERVDGAGVGAAGAEHFTLLGTGNPGDVGSRRRDGRWR